MKKLKKFSLTTIIFFIVAFLFLAVGLGSLGNVFGTGKAYELRLKSNTDAQKPSVVFHLTNPSYVNGEGKTVTDYYRVTHVYLNIAAIYNEADKTAKISLNRGSTAMAGESTGSYTYEATLGNLAYDDATNTDKKVTVLENAVGNWIEPFDLSVTPEANLNVSVYSYYKLSAETCNMLINEVVFVGVKLDGAAGESTGEVCVIPTEIQSAPAMKDGDDTEETEESAKVRAQALIDSQHVPTMAQSSFFRLGKEEVNTMATVMEMHVGNVIYRTTSGNAANVYHGDEVYNSLGMSLLGFGTVIFGTSPFGLRFFPMLASFGILVVGSLFVRNLTKSQKAGLVFAILYALCNFSFGIGHLGTPLSMGVFFFVCALYFMHSFYNKGIAKLNFTGIAPLALSGLFCACAICVNGVYAIASLAVVGLFAAGMVRQNKARRLYLDEAIAAAEAEEAAGGIAQPAMQEEPGEGEEAPRTLSEGKQRVLEVVSEYRWKNVAAPAAFFTAAIIGAMLLSLLFVLPVYMPYVKLYNPANVFDLMGRLFANGFTSVSSVCAFLPFYTVFRGTGNLFAVTGVLINTAALLIGLIGVAYAVYKIVLVCMKKIEDREARIVLRRALIPMGLIVTGAVCAAFGGGALGFIALVYVGMFALAAECVRDCCERAWKLQRAAKICVWVGLGLLAAMFLLYAVFTFSIPLPAAFINSIL